MTAWIQPGPMCGSVRREWRRKPDRDSVRITRRFRTRFFPTACTIGTAGLGLLTRATFNKELGCLFGIRGRNAVEVRKTIHVAAPVERVFPYFARYQAFPRFMAHLEEVHDLGGGRSHWIA